MTFIGFLVIAFLIGLAMLLVNFILKSNKAKEIKNTNQNTATNTDNIDAYKLYSNWCKTKNTTPITLVEFKKLANAQGGIDLADLFDIHKDDNLFEEDKDTHEIKKDDINEYALDLENKKAERKIRDEKFVVSAITGYVGNSTSKGTLIGGSLLGGALGDYLNKKPKK